jgi:hypothetical protein
MNTKLKYYCFQYQLPLLSGVVIVYKQPYETILQTATIQLRNRLRMQLPLGYDHFSLVGEGYIEIDD